ncbi:hypothetical protein JG687_00008968, partial [Phytophthora cactorum]
PACNRRLPALLKDLKKVESVSKVIQGVDVSLLDARVWLDGLIFIKPHYARFIGTRVEIVHSPDFEAGNQYDYRIENDEEEEGFFVEQLQKHRRFAAKETKYDLLHVIPATSSVVERFFSVARTTFGKERHGLLPITLEIILFLRENGTYWDEQTADEATRS